MGTMTFDLEVELSNSDGSPRYDTIKVYCEYSIQNDGIGPYEYWGHKCIDRGIDYCEIDNTDWEHGNYTADEIAIIEDAVKKQIKDWEQHIMDELAEMPDEPDYYDYNDE